VQSNDFVNFITVSAVLNNWFPMEDLQWKPVSNF